MFTKSMIAVAVAAVLSQGALAQSTGTQSGSEATKTAGAEHVGEEIIVTGKFIETNARSALKFDVPVRDIPMTTTNYSDAFAKSIETANVSNLLAYMTGVKRAGNSGSDLTIRGFKSNSGDTNSILYDGLPGSVTFAVAAPSVAYDNIEVVKGPASLLYGEGQPGGFVNFVQKKPQRDFKGEVGLRASAYPGNDVKKGFDGSLDLTGSLNSGQTLMGRAIVSSQSSPSFRNGGFGHEQYAALSLTYEPTDATTLTLMSEYRDTDKLSDIGLIAPNKDINLVAPINVRYSRPTDAILEAGRSFTGIFNHSFDNGMKFDFRARSVDSRNTTKDWAGTAIPPAGSTLVQMRARHVVTATTFDFADTSLLIPVATGPLSHRILLGLNGGVTTVDNNRKQFYTAPGVRLDVYNPDYSSLPDQNLLPAVLPNQLSSLPHRYSRTQAFGAYLSDLITLSDHWKVNLGMRWTQDETSQEEKRLPDTPKRTKEMSKLLPSAAVMWQPTDEWTVYTSYTTSYVSPPANAVDINGVNSFAPISAKQYEVGVKADLLDGNLTATLAIFDIIQEDVLTTFTAGCPFGTCTRQASGQTSRGVELEANYSIVPGWQVTVGYAHTETEITDAQDPAQEGLSALNSPKDDFHLWSRYDVQSGVLQGLGFGVGQVFVSERTGNLPTTADSRVLKLPSYSITDLALYYALGSNDLTLKVGNVFDKRYFESTGASAEINIFSGSPRMVSLSFRSRF